MNTWYHGDTEQFFYADGTLRINTAIKIEEVGEILGLKVTYDEHWIGKRFGEVDILIDGIDQEKFKLTAESDLSDCIKLRNNILNTTLVKSRETEPISSADEEKVGHLISADMHDGVTDFFKQISDIFKPNESAC